MPPILPIDFSLTSGLWPLTSGLLAQIAAPASGSIENWLLSAAAVASMAVLARKLFGRKPGPEPEYLTKNEFHHEASALRDKIDARYLALSEKFDQVKTDLVTGAEQRASASDRRLNAIEATLARLDERSKK